MSICLRFFLLLILIFLSSQIFSQSKLTPYFDSNEYKDLLEITAHCIDTPWTNVKLPYPEDYKMVYRSEIVGLDNRWDLWLREDSVGVISIRGTTLQLNSWLEDFYAAMIPSTGHIFLNSKNTFYYKLSSDTNAYVHAGFLLGLAYLSPTIIQKINEYYSKGVKDFIIVGHSQGGGITFLLRSYLYYLTKEIIPPDITFKTYSSAPPKPGNIYYSYDYELITKGGWSLRVVNTQDWVPQMPFSIQTLDDFRERDFIKGLDSLIAKMNLLEKLAAGYLSSEMLNSANDARDEFRNNLGSRLFSIIQKYLPGLIEPKYAESQYYMTCAPPIILRPTGDYFRKFTFQYGLFTDHMPDAYYFILMKEYFGE